MNVIEYTKFRIVCPNVNRFCQHPDVEIFIRFQILYIYLKKIFFAYTVFLKFQENLLVKTQKNTNMFLKIFVTTKMYNRKLQNK